MQTNNCQAWRLFSPQPMYKCGRKQFKTPESLFVFCHKSLSREKMRHCWIVSDVQNSTKATSWLSQFQMLTQTANQTLCCIKFFLAFLSPTLLVQRTCRRRCRRCRHHRRHHVFQHRSPFLIKLSINFRNVCKEALSFSELFADDHHDLSKGCLLVWSRTT